MPRPMRTQIVLQTRAAQRIGRLSASIRSGAALVAAAARSVEPTARRANETAVVLPCLNSGLSVHTDPHSDGKRRLSRKLLAPLPFRHQRGGKPLTHPKWRGGKRQTFMSTSQYGRWWGMGLDTTAEEQKPHELPNGWMKKLPAATARL